MRKYGFLIFALMIFPSLAAAQQNTLPRSVTGVTGTGAYITAPAGDGAGDSEPFPVECISGCGAAGTQDSNWIQTLGAAVATGVGASGVNTPKVGIASDSTLTSVGTVSTVTAVTTVGTITNPVGVKGADGSGIASVSNPVPVVTTATATANLTHVASTALESSHVLKSGAGNLFALTTKITTVSGNLLVYDATSAPSDGAVTPAYCFPIISTGATGGVALSWPQGASFATGITVVYSSNASCFTQALSNAAFFGDFK